MLKVFAAATLALVTGVTHAQDLHGACYAAGLTGEGFPVISCPFEGADYYIDLDGTDGALGTVGDGRWVQLP